MVIDYICMTRRERDIFLRRVKKIENDEYSSLTQILGERPYHCKQPGERYNFTSRELASILNL